MTSARRRKPLDVGRLAEALAREGNDLRVWNTLARVDDDPDAVEWHPKLGFLVDTEPYGGELSGNAEVRCRVLYPIAGAGVMHSVPIERKAEVAIQVTDGDSEANPVILGQLHNAGGGEAQTAVAGIPLSGDTPLSVTIPIGGGFASISPFDSELHFSPYHRVEELGGRYLLRAARITLEPSEATDGLFLGSSNATHPVLQGDAYTVALSTFAEALKVYATAIKAVADPSGAALTALATAVELLKTQLPLAHSRKVKTE